jgi:UTP-glucose-1-phosphate uridylyltransferase/transcriptional regulator with XRE-family HTH domain
MSTESKDTGRFAALLSEARRNANLTRERLAELLGMHASYIYRLETGGRRPSRRTLLALAGVFRLDEPAREEWLLVSGYAPSSLLVEFGGAIRTGGAFSGGELRGEGTDVRKLEALGFGEAALRGLLSAADDAGPEERHDVALAVSTTIGRLVGALRCPVRCAVVPAAGRQHNVMAPQLMQRLLLRAIAEAAHSGIREVIVVLAPGTLETQYEPLREATEFCVVPRIKLLHAIQHSPEGLGHAVLQAEEAVAGRPFAVLLPDDVMPVPRQFSMKPEFDRLVDAVRQLPEAHFVATASIPRMRMQDSGLVRLSSKPVVSGIHRVLELVEKASRENPIYEAAAVASIIGRYVLQPAVFAALRQRSEKGRRLELTDALESLRSDGATVYAVPLRSHRVDFGRMITSAGAALERL